MACHAEYEHWNIKFRKILFRWGVLGCWKVKYGLGHKLLCSEWIVFPAQLFFSGDFVTFYTILNLHFQFENKIVFLKLGWVWISFHVHQMVLFWILVYEEKCADFPELKRYWGNEDVVRYNFCRTYNIRNIEGASTCNLWTKYYIIQDLIT